MKQVNIWTDGGAKPNPGKGGWGVLLFYNGHRKWLYGGEPETTNNQMELTAAIKALESLKEPCEVNLHTDSNYVVQGMKSWVHSWLKTDWMTSQKKPVVNKYLWIRLYELSQIHKVNFIWVKGHSTDKNNNFVDELATKGRESL